MYGMYSALQSRKYVTRVTLALMPISLNVSLLGASRDLESAEPNEVPPNQRRAEVRYTCKVQIQ